MPGKEADEQMLSVRLAQQMLDTKSMMCAADFRQSDLVAALNTFVCLASVLMSKCSMCGTHTADVQCQEHDEQMLTDSCHDRYLTAVGLLRDCMSS